MVVETVKAVLAVLQHPVPHALAVPGMQLPGIGHISRAVLDFSHLRSPFRKHPFWQLLYHAFCRGAR